MVQRSFIYPVPYTSYFPRDGVDLLKAYNRKEGTTDDLSGTREQNRDRGRVSKKIITRRA